MESGLLASELLPNDVHAILHDDFFSLKSDVDFCNLSSVDDGLIDNNDKMNGGHQVDSWDPDVLLSTSGLPEINPLLELDGTLTDDYQKMLSDWENQIGFVQQSSELHFPEDALGVMQVKQENIFDELLRPSGNSMSMSQGQTSLDIPAKPSSQPQQATPAHSGSKRSHARIVISSGPGDHFAMYEGTQKFAFPANSVSSKADKTKPTSLLRINNPGRVMTQKQSSCVDTPNFCQIEKSCDSINQIPPDQEFAMPHCDITTIFAPAADPNPPVAGPGFLPTSDPFTLDEVVVEHSSMHVHSRSLLKAPCRPTIVDRRTETLDPLDSLLGVQVLEASDVDQLFDDFEATAGLMENDCEADFDDLDQDINEATQIVAAVKNHFAQSDKNSNSTPLRNPRIVPSQQIKDALPKEIIESIKATSQRSRTIAIIEPVNRANSSENSQSDNSFRENSASETTNVVKNENFTCHSQGLATRFQEAATSLNKTKQIRQLGVLSPNVPSLHQAPVSLDHDYCSSGSKTDKLQQRWTAPISPSKELTLQQQQTQKKWSMIGEKKPTNSLLNVNKVSSPIVIGSTSSSRPFVRVVTGRPTVVSTVSQFRTRVVPTEIRLASPSTAITTTISVASAPIVTPKVQPANSSVLKSGPIVQIPSKDSVRLDSDPKKDSGLESGEVSDASEPGNSQSAEDDGLFNKVPQYLTSIQVENSDSRTISEADEYGCYDRLPAYVKIVPNAPTISSGRPTLSVVALCDEVTPARSETPTKSKRQSKSRSPSKKCDIVSPPSRFRRRRTSSSSSSISSGYKRNKSSTNSRRRSLKKRSRSSHKRSRSRSSHRRSRSRSSHRRTRSRSSNRRTRSRSSNRRTRSRSSHRRTRSRSSPSPPRRTHFKTRSPQRAVFSIEKQKLEQQQRQRREEKNRQVEERRVVYVGKIRDGTTRSDLKQRFEVFGPILEISLHFRDRGDNYGFVTFKYKNDAYEAIERGNDNPGLARVDLCFGGRRTFCKEKYSDLDYAPPSEDEFGNGGSNDFDALLKQARAGIKRK